MPSQWVQRFLIKYRVQGKVSQRAFGAKSIETGFPLKWGYSNRNDAFLMIHFVIELDKTVIELDRMVIKTCDRLVIE